MKAVGEWKTDIRTTDMASGPVCAMVWEGREVVKTGRTLLGATNPLASAPGTIRGDFAIVRPTQMPPTIKGP